MRGYFQTSLRWNIFLYVNFWAPGGPYILHSMHVFYKDQGTVVSLLFYLIIVCITSLRKTSNFLFLIKEIKKIDSWESKIWTKKFLKWWKRLRKKIFGWKFSSRKKFWNFSFFILFLKEIIKSDKFLTINFTKISDKFGLN